MRREPVKHHYIPQFILRNFCFEDNRLLYCNKETGEVSVKETKDIFMVRNLYRDEINHAADPVQIEKDLARYEQEVAQILKERFLDGREIYITPQEDDKLRLFFAIMGFRSLNISQLFGAKLTKQSKKYYKQYQTDGGFLDLWKRNLGYIVQCRSFDEVWNHPQIDDPMKIFFRRDTVGYFGKYIVVAEASDDDDFIIGDTYPVVVTGTNTNGLPLNMYDIFPISSKRVLFMANLGVEGTPRDVLFLRNFLFLPPKYIQEQNLLRIRVKKLSRDEVQHINKEIAINANQGFAFRYHPISLSLPQDE